MKRILISGYLGFENSGDESILQAITSSIRDSDQPVEFTVFSSNPSETKEKNNVNSVQSFNPFAVIKSIKNCDILLSGGGNLLQDRSSSRSIWYYLFIIYMGTVFKKKVMLYANGVGPLVRTMNRKLVRRIVNNVSLITLREPLSEEILHEIGVNRPPIHVTADPVFLLEGVEISHAKQILEQEGIDITTRKLGICVREWGTDHEIKKFASLCDQIVNRYELDIVFIPMQYPQDKETSLKIQKAMKSPSKVIQNKYASNEQIKLIGCMDMILSMRLHSLIYACIEAVPMIGLIYDEKIKYYLDQVRMPYLEDLKDVHEEALFPLMDQLMERLEETKQSLKQRTIELKNKAMLNNKYLFDLMNV